MIRDYISYELQRASDQIKWLNQRESDIKKAESREKRREAEEKAEIARENLLVALPPTITYEFLDVTDVTHKARAIDFRSTWQKKNRGVVDDCLQQHIKTWQEGSRYYKDIFESPKINLAILPLYSFVIQFTFTLDQPYISRDEQDFYIIDNPVRKDKIFGLPYVASTSWKGSLRATFRQLEYKDLEYKDKANVARHLFGNEKDNEDPNDFQAGCLYFYPTFFTSKSLEIINPQDRKLRVGQNPIPFESVPIGTTGVFTLLYIPFDLVGRDEQKTREQVAQDLQLVAKGLQAMFRIYGFGAKTSSGFGHANESVANGLLRLRVKIDEVQKAEAMTPISQPLPSLQRYLEAPDRLKPEYLTVEGTFRERSEAELKKMSKTDRQLYDKAKSWWQREGKQLAEAAKQPKPIEQTRQEIQQSAVPIVWPKYSFKDFSELATCANERAEALCNGGGM